MGGNMTTALVALCALMCINAVSGGIGFGKCPPKTAKRQFEISKYTGRWYEISSFGAFFEFNGKCVQAVYTPQSDNRILVQNALVDKLTHNVRRVKGSAVPADSSGDAKLAVTFPMTWGNRTGPYWVLDTDYDNYSIVYACSDIGIAYYDFGWILSRRPVLEEQYLAIVDIILAANNLKRSQYSPTIQDCGIVD